MRKLNTFLILGLLFFTLSCNRKRQLPGFDTEVLIPLANTSIGFDKLISDSSTKVNADQSIDMVYRYPFYEYSLRDILIIPDTSVTITSKLGTSKLSNNFLQQKMTLGQISKNLGTTGQLIVLLNGQTTVIPAIPATTANQATDIDANSFFKEADLTSGFLDLTIFNDLPIPVSDLDFNVKNKVAGQMIFTDTFSLIPAGASITRSYDMAGKHIEGNMLATLVAIGSPGSGGLPVLIDTTKAIVLQLKIRGLTASHAIAQFPKQDLVVVDDTVVYDLGKARLKQMLIRSGKVKMQMYSTLQDTLFIDYKIPSALKNNDTVHMYLKVPPALPGSVQFVTQEVDLTGYTIDLRGRSGTSYNTFWNIFKASIDSTGKLMPLSTSDSVWIRYGLYSIIPQFAEGYLGQDTINIGPTKSTLEAFSKIMSGNLDLKDIKIDVNVENGIGADASINFDYFTSKNTKKGNTVLLNSSALNSPLTIAPATRIGYTSKPQVSTLSLTTTNSNIKPFIENLPDEVNYKFTAKLNPNGNQGNTNFVDYDSKLIASLDVQMPLSFKADQLKLVDTTGFSIGNSNNTSGIDKGKLNFIFENNYPLSLTVKLYFLNEYNTVIDSVFEGNGALITAPSLDPVTLRTTSVAKSILSINIDEARYERLKLANRIIVVASLNTVGSNYIKLYSDYKLKLKLTGEFTYHAGKR
ncbi:MAG: hypothetical protein NTW54_08595 [Bacteroidetes bacterium]|nr:hypothetical protein [Bacteroidota bacterium]